MIRAHREGRTLTVDVQGRAIVVESPAVRELAVRHMSRGLRSLRVDLRDCTLMDSTFSGMLLSIEHQLAAHDGTLTLVSPSPRVLELLGEMGLDELYAIDVGPRPNGPWVQVSPRSADVDELMSVVLESHEELAHASVSNGPAFRAVVDELRRNPAPR
jgi:anti-sigma B factor antagonist